MLASWNRHGAAVPRHAAARAFWRAGKPRRYTSRGRRSLAGPLGRRDRPPLSGGRPRGARGHPRRARSRPGGGGARHPQGRGAYLPRTRPIRPSACHARRCARSGGAGAAGAARLSAPRTPHPLGSTWTPKWTGASRRAACGRRTWRKASSTSTSGSTGRAKAVPVEHRGLSNLVHHSVDSLGMGPEDSAWPRSPSTSGSTRRWSPWPPGGRCGWSRGSRRWTRPRWWRRWRARRRCTWCPR